MEARFINLEFYSLEWWSINMNRQGFSLVEVLLGMALLMTFGVGLMGLTSMSVRASVMAKIRTQAEMRLNETMEEVMAVRASNFGSLHEGTFHPENVEDAWVLVDGEEDLGKMKRWVEVTKVQREVSCGGERVCPIVESGGVVDPVTFRAKVKVEWEENEEIKTEELESILSFWR